MNVDHNEHPLGNPTGCTGQGIFKRVAIAPPDAGAPADGGAVDYAAQSLLYLKVTHTQPQPMCGDNMPALAMDQLVPEWQRIMLRSWINAGARND